MRESRPRGPLDHSRSRNPDANSDGDGGAENDGEGNDEVRGEKSDGERILAQKVIGPAKLAFVEGLRTEG